MRSRRALVATLCALGCGAPQGPRPGAPAAGMVKHYRPLEMRSDARRADQAVILGTDGANGSTVLPLPAAATTAVVDAMVVHRGGAAQPSGDTLAITLTTAPNPPVAPGDPSVPTGAPAPSPPVAPGDPSVPTGAPAPSVRGTVPSGAAGTPGAARWNAGLWSAAVVAADTLGKDLPELTFSAVPAGPVEDVAASALIAAGFLATMTGATIDPAATLAGTVNPDGTIGPVVGIPEQFLGAIAHGKTRLGFPSGMRLATSEATGKPVDLVQLARDHHAEAVELATVADAYRLLTRRPLPAPVPVSEADMALDPGTRQGLEAVYLAWQKQLAGEWAPLLELEQAGRLPATIQAMTRFAKDHSEAAEALHRAGNLPAAYGRMLAAWVFAAAANDTNAVVAKLAAGDVDGAVAALAAFAPGDASLSALFTRIGALRPSTLAGHLGMLAAFQAALRGWAYQGFAGDVLRAAAQLLTGFQGKPQAELGAPATADTVSRAIAPAVVMMLRTSAESSVAEQELALERDDVENGGLRYAGSPGNLARLAAALQPASAAVLGYADAVLVEPLVRSAGLSEDLARQRVAAAEPDYLIAAALAHVPTTGPTSGPTSGPASGPASGLPHELTTAWGDSVAASLLSLAGHEVAFPSAALLVARYDMLAVHIDGAGKIDAVRHPEAFRQLLANAARTARAAARAARIATGAIPVQARLAYQLAAVEASGNLDDQINALAELWASSAASRAAVALARN